MWWKPEPICCHIELEKTQEPDLTWRVGVLEENHNLLELDVLARLKELEQSHATLKQRFDDIISNCLPKGKSLQAGPDVFGVCLPPVENQQKQAEDADTDGVEDAEDSPVVAGNSSSDDLEGLAKRVSEVATSRSNFHFRPREVNLEGTIWDASLLVGSQELGRFGSLNLLVLFLVNLLLQAVFIHIVTGELVYDEFSEDNNSKLMQWRLREGHHIDTMHQRQSLVSRVCARDPTLTTATTQADILAKVTTFLPVEKSEATLGDLLQIGPLLCFIGMFIWTCTCYVEFGRVMTLARALSEIERGPATVMTVKVDRVQLSAISLRRIIFAFFVLLVRFVVAASLLAVGLEYLTHTHALSDLILNAVALGMVINMDELIYDVFVSGHVMNLIECMDPLPAISMTHREGIYLWSQAKILQIFSILAMWVHFRLAPNIKGLYDARDALCSGDINFVFAYLGKPPFFGWSHTLLVPGQILKPSGPIWDRYDSNPYRDEVKAAIIKDEPNSDADESFHNVLDVAVGSLAYNNRLTLQKANVLFNKNCVDKRWRGKWNDAARDELRNRSLPNVCTGEWQDACWQATDWGRISRLLCPQLCGCDRASSTQVLFQDGCQAHCAAKEEFVRDLAGRSRADRSQEQLKNAGFSDVLDHMRIAASQYATTFRGFVWEAIALFEELGCDAIPLIPQSKVRPCEYGPIVYHCPVSCGCGEEVPPAGGTHCPISCNGTRMTFFELQ